jgi:hypothetical protein
VFSDFPSPPLSVLLPSYLAIVLPALVVAIAGAVIAWLWVQHARRRRALRTLYLEADSLEHDLKECRSGLRRAHTALSMGPNRPAAGEADARHAIDAALRELLAHRLWLRDESGEANQRELDAAVAAIGRARGALAEQLRELEFAQQALDTAVREKIEDLSNQ